MRLLNRAIVIGASTAFCAALTVPAVAQTPDAAAEAVAPAEAVVPAEAEAVAPAETEAAAPVETAVEPEVAAAPAEVEAVAPTGEAAAASTDDGTNADTDADDDDDWGESSGPVDRTPRISGVMAASFRGTLRDGDTVADEHTFQIEHTHLKVSGDLTNKLSWEIMPCLTHMNNFSVINAFFEYEIAPALHVTAGRFLLPFGQFNLRSLPGSFDTVSSPLLYQSHTDRMIFVKDLTPENFIFTPRDDTGLQLSGSFWAGDTIQFSYNAYVTNGLRGVSPSMARFWDDNNNGKQLGGRFSASYNGESLTVAAGGSFLSNVYADTAPDANGATSGLNQQAWAADANIAYAYASGRRISLRGEFVNMNREIVPTAELLQGDEGITGAYVTLSADITEKLALFYQWDTLTNRTPVAQQNEAFRDNVVTATRHVGGLSYKVVAGWQLRLEYGRWDMPTGVPDANRISLQTILTF